MLYILCLFFLFGVGGLTGLFLAALATNVPLHDTYFVVAHFHFVMVGAVLTAFLAGLHYWWPKMTGRMYNETLARIAVVLIFIGFNGTFIPLFLGGLHGMMRRYAAYAAEFTLNNRISTVAAMCLGLGMCLVLTYLLASLRNGKEAPPNPWGASTLEWDTTSPPHPHNFPEPPELFPPYQFDDLVYRSETYGYVREKR